MDNNTTDQGIARLDRIEVKIDKMSESLISLARAEERIAAIEEDKAVQRRREMMYEEKLAMLTRQMSDINVQVLQTQSTFGVISKLFWVIIVAIAGTLGTQLIP